MTQTVAEECWSRTKASKRVSGDLSLALMDKTQKISRACSGGFVPDSRHTVEAVGESEGVCSPVHVGSENSCTPKRRCISLNENRRDGFYAAVEVITPGKLSSFERRNLAMRLQREVEQVQKLQKKILLSNAMKLSGVVVSSSSVDPKNQALAGQNIPQLKNGITGWPDSKKHGPAPSSSSASMKQCETLLKRLMRHQYAWVFNSPVDVVKLNIPDYFTVIKHPMDLGTIQSKIASGAYSGPLDFASDVRLTFSNAITYNPPSNDVHIMANTMGKFFEAGWKTIEKKLLYADASMKTVPTKPVPHSKKRKFSLEHCNSVVPEYKPKQKMTDEDKFSLSQQLSLIPELPQHIVDFLRQHTDKANQSCEDELEIDFDSLSDDTLFELRKLLDDFLGGSHFEKQEKNVPCEMETLNESGLSNSSMRTYKENEHKEEDEDEDVDIGGNDPPTTSYFPVERPNKAAPKSSKGGSFCNSSSESGSSSSESDSSGISRSQSNAKIASSPRFIQGPGSRAEQGEQGPGLKPNGSQKGEIATSERRVSPDKLYRAALLRSRFADTILKAREKTLDQGEKKDPDKLRREREQLERQQREERARLQAEAKAAEDARRRAEEEAAAEAKRKRDLEREAARQALLRMERTVVINEGNVLLQDLELLGAASGERSRSPTRSVDGNAECSHLGIDDFNLGGSNPLEQLGLYMKADEEEEEDGDGPGAPPVREVEEGEVD